MKKPRIAIYQSDNNLAELAPRLGRMGFGVKTFSHPRALRNLLKNTAPDLLLVDKELVDNGSPAAASRDIGIPDVSSTLLVGKRSGHFHFFDWNQQRMFRITDLHDYLAQNLACYSRRHLRLETDLPGLLSLGDACHFSRIITLGTGGAFVTTGHPAPEKGRLVTLTIPLLGQKTEFEVQGRVVYTVSPSQENNYAQGVGISFIQPADASAGLIRDYLSMTLAENPAHRSLWNDVLAPGSLERVIRKSRFVGTLPKLCS